MRHLKDILIGILVAYVVIDLLISMLAKNSKELYKPLKSVSEETVVDEQ